MLEVSEVFRSFQGEGLRTGRATVFVRFQGCNLKCAWCDTKYSWDDSEKGKFYEVDQLIEKTLLYGNRWSQFDVCITGGEPLMQPSDELTDFIHGLIRETKVMSISIETNATRLPLPDPVLNSWITYTLSPKLDSSGQKAINFTLIRDYVMLFNPNTSNLEFKFVIKNNWDFRQALKLLSDLYEIRSAIKFVPVVFMPVTKRADNRDQYCAEMHQLIERVHNALERKPLMDFYNVAILPQLHRLVYGTERRGI